QFAQSRAFAPRSFHRDLAFVLGLDHFAEDSFEVFRKRHVLDFKSQNVHSKVQHLRSHPGQQLDSEPDTLTEHAVARYFTRKRANSELRGEMQVAQPALRFVYRLNGISHLIRTEQTDFQRDTIRGQHFLVGYVQ